MALKCDFSGELRLQKLAAGEAFATPAGFKYAQFFRRDAPHRHAKASSQNLDGDADREFASWLCRQRRRRCVEDRVAANKLASVAANGLAD